jgi:hypothetical protein
MSASLLFCLMRMLDWTWFTPSRESYQQKRDDSVDRGLEFPWTLCRIKFMLLCEAGGALD